MLFSADEFLIYYIILTFFKEKFTTMDDREVNIGKIYAANWHKRIKIYKKIELS